MESVPTRELNQHTARVLGRVRDGETIVITDRGRPVARLSPIDDGSELERLIAAGRTTGPTRSALPVARVTWRELTDDVLADERADRV